MIEVIAAKALETGQTLERLGRYRDTVEVSNRVEKVAQSPSVQEMAEHVQPESTAEVELNRRINDLMTQPEGIEALADRHPEVDRKLEKLGHDRAAAEGPQDLPPIEKEAEQYRGTLTEHATRDALAEKFDWVEAKQREVETEHGVTKPDVVLHGAKEEMQFGDVQVKVGDDLYLEVKTGEPSYLRAQSDHILHQVEGHDGKSVVVMSPEYWQIDGATRQSFEAVLKERGSGVTVLDVPIVRMDEAIMRAVGQRAGVAV